MAASRTMGAEEDGFPQYWPPADEAMSFVRDVGDGELGAVDVGAHAWFGRPLWEGSGNSRVIYYERDGTGRARSPCVGPVGTVALLYPGCRVFVGAHQGGANPLVAGVDVLGAHQVGDPSGAELPLDLFTG